MGNKLQLIAELAFAGFLVGLLIGPDTLDQFFGLTYNNSVAFNLIVGTLAGASIGLLGSFLPRHETE